MFYVIQMDYLQFSLQSSQRSAKGQYKRNIMGCFSFNRTITSPLEKGTGRGGVQPLTPGLSLSLQLNSKKLWRISWKLSLWFIIFKHPKLEWKIIKVLIFFKTQVLKFINLIIAIRCEVRHLARHPGDTTQFLGRLKLEEIQGSQNNLKGKQTRKQKLNWSWLCKHSLDRGNGSVECQLQAWRPKFRFLALT